MVRKLNVAVAQLGPIARSETRGQVVVRLIEMMKEAKARNAEFVVFPETALTTFFPRWFMTDEDELDSFFETEMPNAATKPLFETAAALGVGFCLGYAEIAFEGNVKHHYNTSVLVNRAGAIAGKYRKVHLPGHKEHEPQRPFQHLEKRYFEPGNLGFPVYGIDGASMGMFICNDRRWPETWRVMGLKGAELICGGFNTPTHNPLFPNTTTSTPFITCSQCKPAPTRTAFGPPPPPRRDSRKAACFSGILASSRRPAKSSPCRRRSRMK
jgi:predicted amidohydrolase